MTKKNIAVVWGGYSSEKEVSERSAQGIYNFLNKSIYNVVKVCIAHNEWTAQLDNKSYTINKNDFSFTAHSKHIKFDFAYIIIHGTPGEDGPLQGYFDMLNIPYSSSGLLACALTFSKFTCNNFLKSFGFKVAKSILIRQNELYNTQQIVAQLKLPLFVKPNVGGSSFAITKVKEPEKLQEAINEAFTEADEVLVESFIDGTEVTCGCYKTKIGKTVLPITEVVTHNEFFDYEAKYEGQVDEITPARISKELTEQIQQITLELYDLVGAKGIIRADYIISNHQPVLLEINTVPGMTETSFIPQQVEAANLSMTDVLTEIIEYEYNKIAKLIMMDSNTNKKYIFADNKFDDIRPIYDSEVKESIELLLNDKMFKAAVEPVIAPVTWNDFSNQMRSFRTIYEFQKKVIYNIILKFIKNNVDELKLLNPRELDLNKSHTYISNHRDIILDAGLLNISLDEKGYNTTEIAIGDNLLIYPWIAILMRLNKSFIVKRDIPVRQILAASQHLSEYMHKTISEKKQSIWIAQREGRAKDSNDRTQASMLKMLSLTDRKNPIESLKKLNIVPLSISYEYDPCDFLKAQEFQLRRDNKDYKKTKQDDLLNMLTGIQGYKGKVYFRFCKPLNEKIDAVSETQNRSTLLQTIADLIDEEIFKNYEIYTINYIAYDVLNNSNTFSNKYTAEEKNSFIDYVNKQAGKIEIDNKDADFLKTKIIEMYANILINHLSAKD